MKPRLLFYCQHVLGMGHLMRSREIVRALGDFDVCFLNGGEPVEGMDFPPDVSVVQLPPIRSDAEFRDISATDEVKIRRREMLLSLADEFAPEIVIIEMFPFGRRKFAFELVPFVERLRDRRPGTVIASSVRDILVSKRDQERHDDQACRILNEFFSMVLVHADQRFQRLEETFTRAADIRCPIHYTGFVSESAPERPRRAVGRPRIIASAGGGRVGFELLDAVVRASGMVNQPHDLDVFTGPYLPPAESELLRQAAACAPWIRIETFAPDFVERLSAANLLVSQAGYNTCMNIVATAIPALVHPFAGNGNQEQTIRARKLKELGVLQVLESLEPESVAAAMDQALASPHPPRVSLEIDGARRTAALLKECLVYV